MATVTAIKSSQELREKLQVKPPSELVEWISALIYGEAGVGKTFLGGTAADDPRTSPVLFVDIEGGIKTIRHRQDVDVVSLRSMKQMEELGNSLYHSIEKGKIYYGTTVVDSLTELADLDMRTVMKEAYQRNPDKVHIDVPSPREWGIVRNHIRLIVRHFNSLPCHVVWTGNVGVEQQEGQPNKYYPGFAGKLAREVPGFMDIVGYYYNDQDSEGVITRKLQVQGTKRVVAKDRLTALGGGVVENPTIPMIWDLIQASNQAST